MKTINFSYELRFLTLHLQHLLCNLELNLNWGTSLRVTMRGSS